MIAFATLFLGLVVGVHPVDLVVGGEVAAVEIFLNGESRGTIEEAPWTMGCDFGKELEPQLLEAVAYDAAGRELDRARQSVNLPNPPAQVTVLIDRDLGSREAVARLAWESTVGERPRSVLAWLDGKPLRVDDPRHIPLPSYDEEALHLFVTELEFAENVITRDMVTFGGLFGDEVHSELTGIAVLSKNAHRNPPPPEAMRGWFLKDGEPLDVVSAEAGRAEIIFVLGSTLSDLGDRLLPGSGQRARNDRNPRTALPLRTNQSIRFLTPVARDTPGVETVFKLYPMSPELRRSNGGLAWLLTRVSFRGREKAEKRVADAVAVAGLAAYERQYRRAVVLLAGTKMDDASQITPAQSRRYLEHLRVPLFVWSKNRDGAAVEGWGQPENVSTLAGLEEAFQKVNKVLDREWIVWLEGRHLPQDVRLSSAAQGVVFLP